MYLLYLDEAGSNASDSVVVLAGVAVFERQTTWISAKLDALAEKHQLRRRRVLYYLHKLTTQGRLTTPVPERLREEMTERELDALLVSSGLAAVLGQTFPRFSEPVEIHLADIRAGHEFWRVLPKEDKNRLTDDVTDAILSANQPGLQIFGAIVDKAPFPQYVDALRAATEQVCDRFNMYLVHRYQSEEDAQRGLVIFDETKYHHLSRSWVQSFRQTGTRWGTQLRQICDIPYFGPSDATRLLQLADVTASSLFQHHVRGNSDLWLRIRPRSQNVIGSWTGIVHVHDPLAEWCPCDAHHVPARD